MNTLHRRAMMGASLATGLGITFFPKRVFAANERVNIAFVGAGGKGWHAIQCLQGNPMVNMVAFADVDEVCAGNARRAHPDVPLYVDFRKMLDKHSEIDAVVVSTPDHTHHYIARYCMKAGKHVYLEKPLTGTIAQARDLIALEKKTGLACQMGNQGHCGNGYQVMKKWIEEGVYGDVKEVHAFATPVWSNPDALPEAQPIPKHLDWDKWLGPCPERPYNKAYLPATWRGWRGFGNGTLGDWFCHNTDAPYGGLGLDLPYQVDIESTGPKAYSFPVGAKVTYSFKIPKTGKDLKFVWYSGNTYEVPRPEGMDPDRQIGNTAGGTIVVGSKVATVSGTHAKTPVIVPEKLRREIGRDVPKVTERLSGNWDNWLLAIKGEEKTRSNFAYGGRLTNVMHYGNIALALDRPLKIDPKSGNILGDDEAVRLMSGPKSRNGWVAS